MCHIPQSLSHIPDKIGVDQRMSHRCIEICQEKNLDRVTPGASLVDPVISSSKLGLNFWSGAIII